MKKSILIAFAFMFCLNLFGASFAFADVPSAANQTIEYAFDDVSSIEYQTNEQLDKVDGEWWFVVSFVARQIIVTSACYYLTDGHTLH